jgi:NitT/TauT family transport system permease protein
MSFRTKNTVTSPNLAMRGFGAVALQVGKLIAFITIAIFVWTLVLSIFDIPPYLMPGPRLVMSEFLDHRGRIIDHFFFTLTSAFAGLAVSFLVAVTIAGLFSVSKIVAKATLPLLIGLRTVPIIAVAPLIILMFGRGMGTSIVVVVISSFFPILVNSTKGFCSTRRSNLEMMHVAGATTLQTFFKVRLPFAFPHIFTGLRAASAAGLLAAMLAEWLSGAPGLGLLILDSAALKKYGIMWAAVVIAMLMAFTAFSIVACAEKAVRHWQS